MSDETFFREVNEEIRQQRVHDLWRRFGRWLLIIAAFTLVATGVYLGYRQYTISRANAAGDRFIAAVDLADADKFAEAVTQLEAMTKSAPGAYPRLADLRLASIRERQGDAKAALDGFDAVAKDAAASKPIRDIAAIRAGYVLVDTGSFDDVRDRVERLSGDSDALRFPAREAMGLAAWKAGNLDEARRFLTRNRDDAAAPSGISLRARILMELVDAGTTPTSAAAAAAAAPPAPEPAAPAEVMPSPIPLDLDVPSATPSEAPAEATPPAPEAPSVAPETPAAVPEPSAPTSAAPEPAAPAAPETAPAAPTTPDASTPPAPAAEPAAPAPAAETVTPATPAVEPQQTAPASEPAAPAPSEPAAPAPAAPEATPSASQIETPPAAPAPAAPPAAPSN